MNLVQFTRLIVAHLKLIMLVAFVMAGTVFYLTKDEPKVFSSFSVIYTGIASGHTIEGKRQADYYVTSNAFDNLLSIITSRETKEEVILTLLAEHMVSINSDTSYVSENIRSNLLQTFTLDEIKRIVQDNDISKTVNYLYKTKSADDTNKIYELIYSPDPHYSMKALNKMNAFRVSSSDLIKIEFESDDPTVCQRSIELIIDIFIRINKNIKRAQSTSVVEYFERKLGEAQARLDRAEQSFLKFNTDNNIINYYEQTKFISAEKEELENHITELKMTLHGAQAAVKNVEVKLGTKALVELYSTDVVARKSELAVLTNKLTMLELKNKQESVEYKDLITERNSLLDHLEESLAGLYNSQHSTEGLPIKGLLTLWIDNLLKVEESEAKLDDLLDRKEEFLRVYKKMAPIGAELKSIEREIDVSEREYLNILHNLNQAKLKQQNIELSAQLDVIDRPFFPVKPLASKRKMLIIIAFVAGIIVTTVIIVALEFLNSNIKNEEIAMEKTGLESLGVYPVIPKKESKKVFYDKVLPKAEFQIFNRINAFIRDKESMGPPVCINIISTRTHEGKTTFADKIADRYRQLGRRVAILSSDKEGSNDTYNYNFEERHQLSNCYKDLVHGDFDKSNYDLVLFEAPNMIDSLLPYHVLAQADYNILLIRSSRTWGKADEAALTHFMKLVKSPVRFILNGVMIDTLEDIIGDIPRKRGFFRRVIKKYLRMEFKSKVGF